MRLDHIAYRVTDRHKAAEFLKTTLNYKTVTEFEIKFDDESTAECLVLEPAAGARHISPEIFVSNGTADSIVNKWVQERGGTGGIHHMAYQVLHIEDKVKEWKDKGVEFLTENVINCPDDDMKQIFTKPLPELGNIIIELIERGDKGFCQNNVQNLMESTKNL